MPENTKLTPETYKEILGGMELVSIHLKKADMCIERDRYFENGKHKIKILEKSDFQLGNEKNVDICHELKLEILPWDKNKKPIGYIDCVFCLRFAADKPFTQEFFNRFKRINLPVNTWPFFREFIFNISSKMNIPPLSIPLLKNFPSTKGKTSSTAPKSLAKTK